jgi:hypothetical protein
MKTKLLQTMLVIFLMAVMFIIQDSKVEAAGTIYYVDSLQPDDSGDGTSPETAWKSLDKVNATTFSPGDQILFKAGGSWNGQLYPKGSGASGSPIIIDTYGNGNKPIINGNGVSANWDATGGAAVYLYNQEYWEIRNLEVTNTGATAALRYGVSIVASDYGTAHYIHLINLTVHDVNGINTDRKNGGISLQALGNATSTKFDDVLIDGCTVYSVDRTGITLHSKWMNRGGLIDAGPWNPWTNVVVQNNNVYDTGGDGILVRVAQSPLIQYNTSHDVNVRSEDYSAGIWVFNTDDAVLQYNEAYLTRTTLDGQGFDADYNTNRTIIQYNYSHDNEGGFLLIITPGSSTGMFNNGTIVRYNISQNDKTRLIQIFGPVRDASIYNNTFYVGNGLSTNLLELNNQGGFPDGTAVKNNIFYNLGNGVYSLGNSTNTTFDSNVFYGNHPTSEPEDPNKLTSDPMFVNPGSGGIGRNSTGGYQLLQGSPAIDSGTTVVDNGGKDYWGNTVPHNLGTDRGAYEGPGIELAPGSVLFQDDFEDGNADGWTTIGGNWGVVADGASQVFNQSNVLNEALAFAGGGWSNYTYSAKVKLLNSAANAGLTFRAINANNYYMFRINNSTKAVELYKKINGTLTLLSSAAFSNSINQWYTLKVTASGNQITGYVDDIQMISWTNNISELSSGFIGFRMHGATASFDDVIVTSNIVIQDSYDQYGEPQKGIWSFYPTMAAIRTSNPIQITDGTGNTDTYTPLNGYVYVSVSREPLYLKGEIAGAEEDTTFLLHGEDALSGEPIPLTFRMNPLSGTPASISLQVDGQSYIIEANGEQSTGATVNIPNHASPGNRWITAYMLNGNDKFGVLRTSVQIQEPYQVDIRPVVANSQSLDKAILVSVRNHSKVDGLMVKKVNWKLGDVTGTYDINVTVPPDTIGEYAVPLAGIDFGVTYAADVTVFLKETQTIGFTGKFDFNPIHEGSRTIDGVIDTELTDLSPTIDLAKGAVMMGNYGGSSDLSGYVWLHYDADYFYLSANIRDNANEAKSSEFDIWKNDSIQFAISEGLPGAVAGYYEYGISQTPGGPQMYRYITPNGDDFGLVSNGKLEIHRNEIEQTTVYELALPWSELLPSKPLQNGVISFSMLVNDNDGNGRRGYIEWGSGIGSGKKPSAFRSMQWVAKQQTTPDATLNDLQVDGVTVEGFSPEHTGPYKVNVPYDRAAVSITYVTSSPDATVKVIGDTDLTVGGNTVTVTVTAQHSNTKTYTIQIERAGAPTGGGADGGWFSLSSNADLAEFKLRAGSVGMQFSPAFAPDIMNYIAETDEEQIEIVVKPAHVAAKVKWNNQSIADSITIDLKEGENTFVFTVLAEDGTTRKYTLTVHRTTTKPEQAETPGIAFTDITGHWAADNILRAVAEGIVVGYPDGAFQPDKPITRAEFTVMLIGVLQPNEAGAALTFADSADIGVWAQQAVAQALYLGINKGFDDGSFRPNAPITRLEAAAMLARALKVQIDDGATTDFSDDTSIPLWAKGEVDAISKLGLIHGRGGNRFVPNETATRAEAVVMLVRMLELRD